MSGDRPGARPNRIPWIVVVVALLILLRLATWGVACELVPRARGERADRRVPGGVQLTSSAQMSMPRKLAAWLPSSPGMPATGSPSSDQRTMPPCSEATRSKPSSPRIAAALPERVP